MVEHTAENRGVAGSIPALATPCWPSPRIRERSQQRGSGSPSSAVLAGSSDQLEQEVTRVRAGMRGKLRVIGAREAAPNVVGGRKEPDAAWVRVRTCVCSRERTGARCCKESGRARCCRKRGPDGMPHVCPLRLFWAKNDVRAGATAPRTSLGQDPKRGRLGRQGRRRRLPPGAPGRPRSRPRRDGREACRVEPRSASRPRARTRRWRGRPAP